MKKGISIHIGLNFVDPNHYNGWDGQLNACEYDAYDMEAIAKSKGFETSILIREKATRNSVIEHISNAAKKAKTGDLVYVSYSGHGGQIPDLNSDESDGLDETWCLFDGQLIDDEIKVLWTKFKEGVRVLVTSDSCHSGTITKSLINQKIVRDQTTRFMPMEIAGSTFYHNREFYSSIMNSISKAEESKILASIKLISGCQDNQFSYDGPFNGTFTAQLKKVWNGGKFEGNYHKFQRKIRDGLSADQTPNYLNIGRADIEFDDQKPFSI